MQDLNTVTLIGRLVKDAEMSVLNNGSAMMVFTIAVNNSKKTESGWIDEASFIDLSMWGKQAEVIKPYMTKGKQVALRGHLKQDRWEKDGQKQSKLKVLVDEIQLLGSNKKDEPSTSNNYGDDSMPF